MARPAFQESVDSVGNEELKILQCKLIYQYYKVIQLVFW